MTLQNLKPKFEVLLDTEKGVFVARRTDTPQLKFEHKDAVQALTGLVQKLNMMIEMMREIERT